MLAKTDAETVSIRIIDSGVGLSQEAAARLFAPFRQMDESFARSAEGIGLGLALVSTIADLNNIAFTLEPSQRGGAQATLVFRRTEAPLAAPSLCAATS